MYMKNHDAINREREGRENLSRYRDLIDATSKIEFSKFSSLGLIEYSEVVALANYTVYYVTNSLKDSDEYNVSYIKKAIKWAVRNEVRRRYRWYVMKGDSASEKEQIKDAVYKTILSIDELAEAENPTQIRDLSRTPDEKAEIVELKNRICDLMKKILSQREQDLVEAKYFYDKKLKDISVEYNISQSRISRIIQNALDKVKRELLKQEEIDEDNI